MLEPLSGQVAIVTGGGTGIGFAAARALAQAGASVVLFGPDSEVLSQGAKELSEQNYQAYTVRGDVAEAEAVRALIGEVVEQFGRIDIVVNSAAIQPYGTVESASVAEWDQVLAVNLKGIYLTCHYAIPHMKRQGCGSIVNVASVQSIACQENVAAYVASKGGVLALTRAMALDHAKDGIRVNAVCPGTIDTPMLRKCAQENRGSGTEEEVLKRWGAAHPIGRIGKPEEVGAVIAFLCGPGASFCTGAAFRVDGGLLAGIGVVDRDDEAP